MRVWKSTIAVAVLLGISATVVAQSEDVMAHPGFFPLEELRVLDPEDVTVDVNIAGAMMSLIAAATENADPEFASVVSQLKRIRVLVGESDEGNVAEINRRIDAAGRRLIKDGWQVVVKFRNENESVRILVRERDGLVEGLTVLVVNSPDEIALVNIVGRMDPEHIGRLGAKFAPLEVLQGIKVDVDD